MSKRIEVQNGNISINPITGIVELYYINSIALSTDVAGMYSPLGSVYLEEKAAPGADTLTRGQLWVRNDNPSTLMFTDGDSADFVVAGGGAASVFATGTPLDNQVAVFTNGTTIEGDAGLTYSAGTLTATQFSGGGASLTALTAANISSGNLGSGVLPYATAVATASAFQVPFLNTTGVASGNFGLQIDTVTPMTYNPSTGTLVATTFSGALSGNATSATTAAAWTTTRTINMTGDVTSDAVNIDGSGNITITNTAVANDSHTHDANNLTGTILAAGVVTSSLTTVGTIGTGVWQGTVVDELYGGTGFTTYATGDILYASAVNTLSKLAAGTNTHVLTLAAGVPTWAAPAGGGNVSNTGTPVNNQLAVWTDATTIEGDAALTWDGADFIVGGEIRILADTTTATPPTGADNVTAQLEFHDSDNSDLLAEIGFAAGHDLYLTNRFHTGQIILRAEDNSGNLDTLITASPDGAVELYFAGVIAAQTTNTGGLQIINNFSGSGQERALSAADVESGLPRLVYEFSTTTATADPGTGTMRWNNATPASVTEVYVNDQTINGINNTLVLGNLADGDILTFGDIEVNANYLVASVNGAPTDNTGWWTIPVTIIHSATLPGNLNRVNIDLQWFSQAATGGVPTTITVANEAADTTSFPAFFTAATGDLGPKTNAGLTFDASTATLGATQFSGGGASLTSLTAANISTGNLASGVLIHSTAVATNSNFQVPFVNTTGVASGNFAMQIDTATPMTYNPSTGTLVATTFSGALSGNATTATTAGTVTTAAQTNITSVGTLTALTTSGDITLNGTNPSIELQDNGEIHFRDEVGTAEGIHVHMPSSVASNPELHFDSGALNPQVHFRDGMWFRIYEGANTDYLELRHDGTNSWVAHSFTTGSLQLRVNTTEAAVICTPNAAVALYYDAAEKFRTALHTAADMISGAEVVDAEGNMQPVGLGVVINDATTFDTVATHTPFQQANANQTVYFVGAGAGTANFDTYTNVEANQTNIPVGTMWFVQNNAATTVCLIRGGASVTIRYWAGTGAPADVDVTVARGGVATVRKVSDSIYDIWGIGLS